MGSGVFFFTALVEVKNEPVLVDAATSTTSFSLLGEQRAASVAIGLCDSGLSSAAKAS